MNISPKGSSPLDLFKLYVDDLKARYHEEKKLIKEILKEKKFEVELSTSYEQFFDFLNADKRMAQVDQSNVKLTFNSLMEKAELKEKEKQKEENKKLKKLEQSLKSVFKKFEINENSKYEQVREKICTDEAYVNINNDKECERIFNEYISQLQETCLHHIKKKKEKKRKSKRSRSRSNSVGGGDENDRASDEEGALASKRDASHHHHHHHHQHHNDSAVVESMDTSGPVVDKSPEEAPKSNEKDKTPSVSEPAGAESSSKSNKKHKKSKKRKRQKSVIITTPT